MDLSLVITDNMPAHKLFQSPVILPALSHEGTKDFGLGISEDRMTFATNYLGMLDHVGTHVDALPANTARPTSCARRRPSRQRAPGRI